MSDDLETLIKTYSDEHLLEQCFRKRSEYSEHALTLMEKEISRRTIADDKIAEYREGKKAAASEPTIVSRSRDDFTPFEDVFTSTDMMLVSAMFEEAKIPFFVDNPPSTVFPTEALAASFLRMHVQNDYVAQAHELLGEHFVKEEGRYKMRFANDRERLKALQFHDVHVVETLAEADVGMALAAPEIAAVIGLAQRLLGEVDKVEKEQERIVFYYDNLEEFIERLRANPEGEMSKNDFLTVTEILQIYCDDSAFPKVLNDTVAAILAFFDSAR